MKQLLTIILIAFALPSVAQPKIKFSYDNAGNRIKREMTTMFAGGGDDRSDESPEQKPESTLSVNQVNVYPNPAQDWLNISLKDPVGEPLSVELFDQNGRLVRQAQLSGELVSLDVSDQPAGFYALFIRAGTRYLQWKVSIVK
ncbi:MAG TPA: T9SS type A sorting domain-containing protein [Saprospiraceae bacterium]|nr:T9SS type A sorting domain-containing protein [Saprospiraceae bacterium]